MHLTINQNQSIESFQSTIYNLHTMIFYLIKTYITHNQKRKFKKEFANFIILFKFDAFDSMKQLNI